MEIGVVGLGKLGLPTALVFCKAGFEVKGVDANPKRIAEIVENSPCVEPRINEYLLKFGDNLEVSTDYGIIEGCDSVFVVTQTPSLSTGRFDVERVKNSITDIDRVNPECLIVVNSTVNPGDFDHIFRPIHDRLAYNPDFIRQGSVIQDLENPKFVLIGAYREADGQIVADTWHRLHDKPAYIITPIEAEIAKLSLNVSFTLAISFANIIGELCEKYGGDSKKVMDMIYSDRRNFYPGLGFGGPCFPRDTVCFAKVCRENDVRSGEWLGSLLGKINAYTVERYAQKILDLKPKSVAFLGISYKDGIDLIEESQSLKIAKKIAESDSTVKIYVYDKLAEEKAKHELPSKVHFSNEANEVLKAADVVFIGTPKNKLPKIVDPWG